MESAQESGTEQANAQPAPRFRYADVGFNATDAMYSGRYHGKRWHEDDLQSVIDRAKDAGCRKLMITGSDYEESQRAIQLARAGVCYATVGVHPCSANTFHKHSKGAEDLLARLRELARDASAEGLAVAFGEIGLDYDRLFLSTQATQLEFFDKQLDIAVELQLPLFLHSRAAAEDFERLLIPRIDKLPKRGLVHSFTGTKQEMERLVGLGFDIGVNGCSLKTEENLEVVKAIPLEKLQIETDGPWCEIRPSHASSKFLKDDPEAPILPKAVKKEKFVEGSMVKGRNEPCTIAQVAHVIARLKEVPVEQVCAIAWSNTRRMFGMDMEE